jgi:hypothetical protein
MRRKGMDLHKGKGYRNIKPMYAHDKHVHRCAGKGISQPQKMPQFMLKKGDFVTSKFTQAKGTIVSTDPFAVKYHADSRDYVRLSNPKFWQKGGKVASRFKNYSVFRVGTLPKNAKVRLDDIGRTGHSYRMTYQDSKGKWHTYQFLISKKDIDSPKSKKLIMQLKARYNIKGGKDMPVQEIDEVISELPEGTQVEAKPSFIKKIGAGIGAGLAEAGHFAKETYKGYKERAAEKKLKEFASEKATYKPQLEKLEKQRDRVEELKEQIANREEKGQSYSNLTGELETEEKQLRQIQEKVTELPLDSFDSAQLRRLAIMSEETGLFGGNRYETELLRRIKREKIVDREIAEEKKKPVERGFWS